MTASPPERPPGGDSSARLSTDNTGLNIGAVIANGLVIGVIALVLSVLGSMAVAGIEIVVYNAAGVRVTGVEHWPWNAPGALLGLFIGFEAVALRYVRLKRENDDRLSAVGTRGRLCPVCETPTGGSATYCHHCGSELDQ